MVGFWGFAERLGKDIGLRDAQSGPLFSLALVAGLAGAVLASVLGHRGRLVSNLLYLYLAVIVVIVPLALWPSLAVYAGVIVAFQLVWIALNILQMAFVAQMDRHQGLVAIAGVAITAGGAAGPVAAGYIRTSAGDGGIYLLVIIVTLVCLALTAVLGRLTERVDHES
jgi:predicted MFS family arabinose efflux permease